jgi:hypothetical protein
MHSLEVLSLTFVGMSLCLRVFMSMFSVLTSAICRTLPLEFLISHFHALKTQLAWIPPLAAAHTGAASVSNTALHISLRIYICIRHVRKIRFSSMHEECLFLMRYLYIFLLFIRKYVWIWIQQEVSSFYYCYLAVYCYLFTYICI